MLAMCEEQEEKFQFDHFSRADALAFGLKLHENAKKQPIPVAIEITVNGLVVFRYFPDGALPDSELWLQRKRRTVDLMQMSSHGWKGTERAWRAASSLRTTMLRAAAGSQSVCAAQA